MASVTVSTTPQTLLERKAAPGTAPQGDVRDGAALNSGSDAVASAPPRAGTHAENRHLPRASLAKRMGLIAAVWITVLLLGGGIALERSLSSQVESNFDDQLEFQLTAMIASAEIDSFGDVMFDRALGDQRYLEPGSGLYWQISGDGFEPWPSRSLWDRTLKVPTEQPGDGEFNSDLVYYDSDQFSEEPLRIARRTVILPGSDTHWTFAVASATSEVDAQTRQVRSILIWSFAVLGFGLMVMALMQIRYGLSPLRRVRAAIQTLRTTGENRITEPLPTEVQPLVEEVNALLEHTERQAEEARMHAGNLAHALKTPLTVLTNAATARDPDLSHAVFRETKTMQRHVDHHLARARAVGRRAVGQARTNVCQSAEAVLRAVERLYPEGRLDVAGNKDVQVAIERQDLDEILGNLIENAAKYGGGSVFVTIDVDEETGDQVQVDEATEKATHCLIWVEDDGQGIPSIERERIFDRGARLDTGKPGTGLGLAIVRDVAEIYGGSVELGESEDLGGLLVQLRLPRV